MKNSWLFLFCLFVSCNVMQKPPSENSRKEKTAITTENNRFVVSGQLISKEMIRKNGKAAGFGELYYRLSVQDYFIKFCESSVTKEELEPFVNTDTSFVSVTMEVSVQEGDWDICEGSPAEMQSRIGKYIVVHKLFKR
jgi:hypothetical protein